MLEQILSLMDTLTVFRNSANSVDKDVLTVTIDNMIDYGFFDVTIVRKYKCDIVIHFSVVDDRGLIKEEDLRGIITRIVYDLRNATNKNGKPLVIQPINERNYQFV